MSPTMTEGTIHDWKVKEGKSVNRKVPSTMLTLPSFRLLFPIFSSSFAGDSFSAGDVLLELETDKAQIDVEAADDGVMAKILVYSP